ncbi:MAG: DUF1385 domain-containing protein, partial [Eubacteriales bacterium]|nr:DUF1385 domain-containing protein [Eubacteriales bacterium]
MAMAKTNKCGLWDKDSKPAKIGGEALIEGVMMKSPEHIAIAIRKSDGEIIVDKKKNNMPSSRYKVLRVPLIRGAVTIIESMVVGMKALMQSAEYAGFEDENEGETTEEPYTPSKTEKFLEKITGGKLKEAALIFSVFFALLLGVGIFFILPNLIAGLFKFDRTTAGGVIIFNLTEGIIRIA